MFFALGTGLSAISSWGVYGWWDLHGVDGLELGGVPALVIALLVVALTVVELCGPDRGRFGLIKIAVCPVTAAWVVVQSIYLHPTWPDFAPTGQNVLTAVCLLLMAVTCAVQWWGSWRWKRGYPLGVGWEPRLP